MSAFRLGLMSTSKLCQREVDDLLFQVEKNKSRYWNCVVADFTLCIK